MTGTDLINILRIGFSDGLLWFPFVLGVGLLYTYFKEIDISVDGIAVLSGISTAYFWRGTDSYSLSLIAGIATGVLCSSIVCGIQVLFRISGLMAGLMFSLAAHSLSVILIGESMVMSSTRLVARFGNVTWWQVVLVVFLLAFTTFFYQTKFGLACRKLGGGCLINTVYHPGILKWSGYLIVGLLYGLGGSIYAHSQGMAKSGGSFEFLLVSLPAFFVTDRIIDIIVKTIRSFNRKGKVNTNIPLWDRIVFNHLLSSPVVKAIIGAIVFETLLFAVIMYSPNPILWKLLFALMLLVSMSNPQFAKKLRLKAIECPSSDSKLDIQDLCMHYDIGTERRNIFSKANAVFQQGLSLIQGPNGAGKSTLLKGLYGLVKPTEGHVHFNGRELLSVLPHRRPIFLIMQNPVHSLGESLTVAENLFVISKDISGGSSSVKSDKVILMLIEKLERLGLNPIYPANDPFWHKPVISLSGGEIHIVSLYSAILADAPILLTDEPTTGLDETNFESLMTVLRRLANKKLVLITSHDGRISSLTNQYFKVGNGKITHQQTK